MTTFIQSLAFLLKSTIPPRRVMAILIVWAATAGLGSHSWAADSQPAHSGEADVQKLFESGNERFRAALEVAKSDRPAAEAKFREAAGAWREVARLGGIHNVKLETNIANASLLAGDVAGAILAYRRALAIDPTDPEVLAGLAAARRSAGTEALALGKSLAKKEEAGGEGGLRGTAAALVGVLQRTTESATNAVSSRVLLFAAAACYLAFFAGATLRVSGKARTPWLVLVALGAAMIAAAGPLIVREIRAGKHADAVVMATNVIARNGPAEVYDPSFQEPLRAGVEVAIVETRGSWTKVRLRDGREAWVRTEALAVV